MTRRGPQHRAIGCCGPFDISVRYLGAMPRAGYGRRFWWALLFAIIGVGILSRVMQTGFRIVDKYLGDALYAAMIYVFFRLSGRIVLVTLWTAVAVTSIELFQLTRIAAGMLRSCYLAVRVCARLLRPSSVRSICWLMPWESSALPPWITLNHAATTNMIATLHEKSGGQQALTHIVNSQPGMTRPAYGALVISIDFELHWGVRDNTPVDGPYRSALLGAREAVPRMLDIFEEFDISATWATVGFLFARDRQELEDCSPRVRPAYQNKALNAYQEQIGANEREDPLHYAASLIEEIRRRPRQELATHTFSHYYCQEEGQTADTFHADLKSAIRIAARYGATLRSIVFPRNQYNPEYSHILRELGITSYRGTEASSMYAGSSFTEQRKTWRRGARILDNYISVSGANLTDWGEILQPDGLCNIRSSRFLRPYSNTLAALEPLRRRRIVTAMEEAARTKRVFHLNWHPHNFGVNLEENMRILRSLLESFARYRDSYGMRSMSMQEVAMAVTAPAVLSRSASSRV